MTMRRDSRRVGSACAAVDHAWGGQTFGRRERAQAAAHPGLVWMSLAPPVHERKDVT